MPSYFHSFSFGIYLFLLWQLASMQPMMFYFLYTILKKMAKQLDNGRITKISPIHKFVDHMNMFVKCLCLLGVCGESLDAFHVFAWETFCLEAIRTNLLAVFQDTYVNFPLYYALSKEKSEVKGVTFTSCCAMQN